MPRSLITVRFSLFCTLLAGVAVCNAASAQNRVGHHAMTIAQVAQEVTGEIDANTSSSAFAMAFAEIEDSLSGGQGGNLHIDYEVVCVSIFGVGAHKQINVDYPDFDTLVQKLCDAGAIVKQDGLNQRPPLACSVTALSDDRYGYPYDVAREVYGCPVEG